MKVCVCVCARDSPAPTHTWSPENRCSRTESSKRRRDEPSLSRFPWRERCFSLETPAPYTERKRGRPARVPTRKDCIGRLICNPVTGISSRRQSFFFSSLLLFWRNAIKSIWLALHVYHQVFLHNFRHLVNRSRRPLYLPYFFEKKK